MNYKSKNLRRAWIALPLLLASLTIWLPLWWMAMGALTPVDELTATLGPALLGKEGYALWPLLPSWPTLESLSTLTLLLSLQL